MFHIVEDEYGDLFEGEAVQEGHDLVYVATLRERGSKTILSATEEERADLTVIGCRSAPLPGVLTGSVAEEVVQTSDRPVLVSR